MFNVDILFSGRASPDAQVIIETYFLHLWRNVYFTPMSTAALLLIFVCSWMSTLPFAPEERTVAFA